MHLMLMMQRLQVVVLPKMTTWRDARPHLINGIYSLTLDGGPTH
jgi:hypothetical protein